VEDRFFGPILKHAPVVAAGLLVGRILMAFVFVLFGVSKAVNTPRIQEYMRAHNVAPELVYLTIAVQIGFGILVAVGYQTRFSAMMLAGFCVIATSLFHTAWNEPGELSQFTKDFAIAGGFLFMIAHGPGALSLDAYLAGRRKRVPSPVAAMQQ